MAEVRTSSQCERPCAGIEETRKPPGDAGGSSSPVNGDDHTGKRLAGKPHEPFERADGGRATARPPPTLQVLIGCVVESKSMGALTAPWDSTGASTWQAARWELRLASQLERALIFVPEGHGLSQRGF